MIGRVNIMDSFCRRIVVLFSLVWLSFASSHDFITSHYPGVDVITRDICVIGGGASGTYAAIRLKDLGKSVVVVEREDRLGGHTQTYIDPATQIPIDYGVKLWNDISVTRNFAKRLNVSLVEFSVRLALLQFRPEYVDFRTGKLVNYTPSDPTAALAAYGAQLAKYPYLLNGLHLQYPVPEDLLIPFGDFVIKYSLQDMVETLSFYVQGVGDLLRASTIYVLTFFGEYSLESALTHFLIAASHDNSELYQSALGVLGSDALLSSQVVATDRRSDPEDVKILVTTPNGLKLIQAKKLIIAIPQTLENLKGFDLSDQECTLFAQFKYSAYYTSVIKDTGIPDDVVLNNQAANTTYNLPVLPGIYNSEYGAPNLKITLYGSQDPLRIEEVKANIINDLKRFQTVENLSPGITPSFEVFASHTPFHLRVSPEAIAGGFYKELYALQGQSRTFYTGAAFFAPISSLVWEFTEALLPSIVAK